MFKYILIMVISIVGLLCWITHILSRISRIQNTPKLVKKFNTEIKPDLDTSLSHSQLNIGANKLMAKQAVCSFGIWVLQLRYADMKTLNNLLGNTLLDYYHRLQKPISLCEQDSYRKSFAHVIEKFMLNLKYYRDNVSYNKHKKHTRGDLIRFIKTRLKHKLDM